MSLFADTLTVLEGAEPMEPSGRVAQVRGLTVSVIDLNLPVGAAVRIECDSGPVGGEVIGLDDECVAVMPLGETAGIRRGDRVIGISATPTAVVGHGLLGRVIDGLARPIDGRGPLLDTCRRPLRPYPLGPMGRAAIDRPLGTGVRVIDSMLTVGRGQRLGIFSGSGVGKSTLLGTIARSTDADVSVIALIGERGREVGDFVRLHLGDDGLARAVVVAATADEPALMRIRASWLACAAAEYFRDQGLNVLLIMDSVTRFAQSQRQVGLAAGEAPATRGYTPGVFAAIPGLLERCGAAAGGSITGFFAVLVEGDDLNEPVADACRAALDGHIVLSRELADRGHHPAVDVPASVSRVAPRVTDEPHRLAREQVARLITAYRGVEDLLSVGAYVAGSNPMADLAIEMKDTIDGLLRQRAEQSVTFHESKKELLRVATTAARLAARKSSRGSV